MITDMAKKTGQRGRPTGEPKVYKTAAVHVEDWEAVQEAWNQFGACSFTEFSAWLIGTHPAVQEHRPQPSTDDSTAPTLTTGTADEQEVLASA